MNPSKRSARPIGKTKGRILGRLRLRHALLLFLAALAAYAAGAADRLRRPSEHLHFVDLAESFMAGRLDTETPKKRCRKGRDPERDPAGFESFVCRHSLKPDGSWEGWNDWSSYHRVRLTDGTDLAGVWPFGDTKGADKNKFITLDGDYYVVDKGKDLARGCDPKRRGALCDEQVHYVSFPPAPAVLILPFAAIWHYRLNDVVWTLLFGALGFLGTVLLLERLSHLGLSRRTLRENVILSVLICFGTSLYFSAVRGEVWFTALVMGYAIHVIFAACAIEARRPILAGCALAVGMATRTPIAFAAVFMGLELLRLHDWRTIIRRGLIFSVPILAIGGLLCWYNQVRFGSPFEFGHTYLQDGMRPSIRKHGLFSVWFLNANLSAALSNVPLIVGDMPFVRITRHGLSIFAATPAFILLFRPRVWRPVMTSALVAVAAILVPALLYQNTGWAQFSYRFSIDALPYFALLLAAGDRPLDGKFKLLFALSVLTALFGAITFGRFEHFYIG